MAFVEQSPVTLYTSHKGYDCGDFRRDPRRERAVVRKSLFSVTIIAGLAGKKPVRSNKDASKKILF